jgi:hypothetical protein
MDARSVLALTARLKASAIYLSLLRFQPVSPPAAGFPLIDFREVLACIFAAAYAPVGRQGIIVTLGPISFCELGDFGRFELQPEILDAGHMCTFPMVKPCTKVAAPAKPLTLPSTNI